MYKVFISRSAEKYLKRLSDDWQAKIAAVIASLEITPRPHGCKKLSGTVNSYRVRVGNYRIIYDVNDRIITVTVLKEAHRRESYR